MTCASLNGKFDDEVISKCVVPIKISHQNCKNTIRRYVLGIRLCCITVVREVSSNNIYSQGWVCKPEFENTYWREVRRDPDDR